MGGMVGFEITVSKSHLQRADAWHGTGRSDCGSELPAIWRIGIVVRGSSGGTANGGRREKKQAGAADQSIWGVPLVEESAEVAVVSIQRDAAHAGCVLA